MAIVSENRTYDLAELSLSDGNKTMDLRSMFAQLSIYEDITLPVITAQLAMVDDIGLIEMFPLVGIETVKIKYSSSVVAKHPYFEKTFAITKITNLEMVGHRKVAYVIHLATIPAILNANKRIRRSYTDSTSNIVTNICKNMLGITNIDVESNYHSRRLVIPNLRPFDAISKMCNISLKSNSDDKVADYTFFENIDGHVFKSMQTLSQSESVQTLKVYDQQPSFTELDLDRVNRYEFPQVFDQLSNISDGLLNNKQMVYNSHDKTYKKFSTNYASNFAAGTHLDKGGLQLAGGMTALEDANESFIATTFDYVYDTRMFSIGARISQTQAFSNYILNVDTFGNTLQSVGKVVEFNLISIRNSEKVELDDDLSGRYLIFKKKHTLTASECSNTIEIRKDCLRN